MGKVVDSGIVANHGGYGVDAQVNKAKFSDVTTRRVCLVKVSHI